MFVHRPENDSETARKNEPFCLLACLHYRVFDDKQRLNRICNRDAGQEDELQFKDTQFAERNGKRDAEKGVTDHGREQTVAKCLRLETLGAAPS